MKKNFFAALAVVIACTNAFAGSAAVTLTLAAPDQTVRLSDAVGHTEYHQVLINRTCSRQVLIGYHRECRVVTDQNCTIVSTRECNVINGERICQDRPTRVCNPVQRRECWDVADHRTEYYDCSYYETVGTHVHDYNTSADVRVLLDNVSPGLNVNETLQVKLSGANVSLASASKTSKSLLLAEVETQAGAPAGGVQQITSLVHVTALPVADVAGPLSSLKILQADDKGVVAFGVSGLNQPDLFAVKITLKDPVFLGSDKVIAERELLVKDLQAVKTGAVTRLSLNLSDIGVDPASLAKGKYSITVKLKSLLNEGAIVNRQSLPAELHSELSAKFKKK